MTAASGRQRLLKLSLLGLFLAAAATLAVFSNRLGWLDPEAIITAVQTFGAHRYAPLAFLAIAILACWLGAPMSPVMLAGGALFGTARGGILNYLVLLVSSAAVFATIRFLGRESARRWMSRLRIRVPPPSQTPTSFWLLFGIRYLPIPFFLVNSTTALSHVTWRVFVGSTALAYIPQAFAWSFAAATIFEAGSDAGPGTLVKLGLGLFLVGVLVLLPIAFTAIRRKAQSVDRADASQSSR